MIAAWMVYCLAIGFSICIAGWAAERALYLAGRPTRWAWSLALLSTLLLPVAALLRPQGFGSITIPLAPPASTTLSASPVRGNAAAVAEAPQPASSSSWADFDGILGWGWGVTSAGVLFAFALAAVRLADLRRRWHRMEVDGRSVLVADEVGPAVTGLWPPRVVIPSWALALTEQQRRLMLSHEEEHVQAGDPWVLAGGTAALIAAPWNPALWWLLRRLRHAVEMDCDARVVRTGHSPLAYGQLLLRVGQRQAHLPLAAVAFGEPRSLLELRIRRLSARLPRRRWLGVTAATLVAGATIVAACETPRPVSPELAARVNSIALPNDVDIRVSAVVDSLIAESMRPWVQENLKRYYPDLLREPSGPPVDVWFGHDSQFRLLGVARTAPGSFGPIGSEQIGAVFNRFRPGNDAWRIVDRRTLRGLVRDNVRVISVHLGPDSSGGFSQFGPDVDNLRLLARSYHPEAVAHPLPDAAIALVFDAHNQVVGHAAGVREARDGGCFEVVQRLVPAFANSKWSEAGCTISLEGVVVYWMTLR